MSFINDIMDKGKEFMEDQVEKGLNFIGQDGESESSFNSFHPVSSKNMVKTSRHSAYHISQTTRST